MKYDNSETGGFTFPLAPSSFKTKVGNKNKTIELVTMGEVNIIKNIGLREFSFKVLFPGNENFAEKTEGGFHEPIYYLSRLREIKAAAKPIRFMIQRVMPNGSLSFPGDLLVTLEDYTVEENAGEEGDYWVDIKLKEYRAIDVFIEKLTGEETPEGEAEAVQEAQRETKEPAKSYTVQSGDNLWRIAVSQLNDGSRWGEIAELNGIDDPKELQAGQVLNLP